MAQIKDIVRDKTMTHIPAKNKKIRGLATKIRSGYIGFTNGKVRVRERDGW